MKRNNKKRLVDNSTPRQSRSDHGDSNNKGNNQFLYTPPIGKSVGNQQSSSRTDPATTHGGDSALLKRLEKITSEINTMQTYPSNQHQNQNQNNQNYSSNQYNPQAQFNIPSGYPSSFSTASPRAMDYTTGRDGMRSPRQANEIMSNWSTQDGGANGQQQHNQQQQHQHQEQELSPQHHQAHQHQQPHQYNDGSLQPLAQDGGHKNSTMTSTVNNSHK
jgi:hypothetical protein